MAGDRRLELRGSPGRCRYERFLFVVGCEDDDGDGLVARIEIQEGVVEREDETDLRGVAVGLGDLVLAFLHRGVAEVVEDDGLRLQRRESRHRRSRSRRSGGCTCRRVRSRRSAAGRRRSRGWERR